MSTPGTWDVPGLTDRLGKPARPVVRSEFMAARDPRMQGHVTSMSEHTASALDEWVARYPVIRQVRVWPVALSVVAASPHNTLDAVLAVARLGLWIFALDDVFDEEQLPERELMRRADRYQAIALGHSAAPDGDTLAAALNEVRDELAGFALFQLLSKDWATSLCRTIQGMIREYRWRQRHLVEGASGLPSYAEYVENGLYSIGIPPHDWASVITTGDVSAVDCRQHLRAMDRIAGTCVRLANDLRSYNKELAEGNVNSLVILAHALQDQGLDASQAHLRSQAQVREDIVRGLDSLDKLQARGGTKTGYPEGGIADIARFCCDFYAAHDYHLLN
jgi:hypothetical protein